MLNKQGGFIKVVLAVIVILLIFAGYTQWRLSSQKEDVDVDEIGRVVGDLEENPNDQEILDDLERAGTPVEFEDPDYSRVDTDTDVDLLPTQNYSIQGLAFKYAPILTLSVNNDAVLLKHEINSPEHSDYCDFKGSEEKFNSITDFDVAIEVRGIGITDIFREQFDYQGDDFFDQYIDEEDNIIPGGGLVEPFNTSVGDGYTYFGGVEGCGSNTYVVELAEDRTLIINRELIPYLNSAVEKEEYLALPDVISPELEESLFNTLLASLKYNV